MILITGATGKIGSPLVAALKTQQRPFRALAHTAASYNQLKQQQVEAVLASDPAGAAAAFQEVDTLFLLTPTGPDQAATERQFVDLAKQQGVQHIVKLSVFGIDDPTVSLFKAHRQSERYIQQSGLGYTFLRPNLFMQNIGSTDAATVKAQGAIFNAAGAGRISFIDTRDIAAVALVVLTDERQRGQIYDLTGGEAITYGKVAEQLTAALGRSISYVGLSDEAYHGALVAAGLPPWYAQGLTELYAFYRAEKGVAISDAVTNITGRRTRTLEAYLADHHSLFV